MADSDPSGRVKEMLKEQFEFDCVDLLDLIMSDRSDYKSKKLDSFDSNQDLCSLMKNDNWVKVELVSKAIAHAIQINSSLTLGFILKKIE